MGLDTEAKRFEALREYDILDTLPEPSFDSITKLASYICKAPTALISFGDAHRQWFKSRVGCDLTETSRDVSFCAWAINGTNLFIIEDATRDERFAQNPLVTLDPKIRFYAGMPLIGLEGHALGTLCVIDYVSRSLTAEQANALRALARLVVAHLELRRSYLVLKPLVQGSTKGGETFPCN